MRNEETMVMLLLIKTMKAVNLIQYCENNAGVNKAFIKRFCKIIYDISFRRPYCIAVDYKMYCF